MIFGISDEDLMDKNKIKIINGIAGSGKSTTTVNELRRLGSNFCLASFSNALKFAAGDKFGCNVDTICGLEFVNTPHPRAEEKEVTEFDTVINDEILLDGIECINWMTNNVGKVNIIALTDSRQMLSAENSEAVLKAFDKLCKSSNVICVEVSETKRARDDETREVYNELYKVRSNQLFKVQQAAKMLHCDIISIDDISFDRHNTYICHSNKIEHEVYKLYDLCNNRANDLIPKNHISRNRNVQYDKYPICDQITAMDKKIDAYLQQANVATPTRFQGKEVAVGDECYFLVQEGDTFTGREIYTVGTRCQSIKSLHIVVLNVNEYKDPSDIKGTKIVRAMRLDIPDHDKTYKSVNGSTMAKIIKEKGQPGIYYYADIITSGDNIIYSTLPNCQLENFADIKENGEVVYRKKTAGARKTIKSITKKDPTMHFDFLPRVYDILKMEVTPARIVNPKNCKKEQFNKLCDIYSAFPTVLHNTEMPKAGYIYEEYDPELLNFYVYEGNVVTKGSLITEPLAKLLGESRYVFSTGKQSGCELGHYTYDQCKSNKEKKSKVNKNFLWGQLESDFYKKETVVLDGEASSKYVRHNKNILELVSCALWSNLCLVMLNAINSINAAEYLVVTDGLYYNGDDMPELPEWCDYRIERKHWNTEKKTDEKYDDIEYKTYEQLETSREQKQKRDREQKKNKRANMSDEERAAYRAKEAERKRLARAKKKEQ